MKVCKVCYKEFNNRRGNEVVCPQCLDNEYRRKVKEINPYIIPLEPYKNAKTKIKHKCIKHNIEWDVLPVSILSGSGCRLCKKEKLSMSNEEYIARLEEKNPLIVPLENYIKSSVPIRHKCLKDNCVWSARPSDILNGHGCPLCAKVKKRSQEEYESALLKINPNIKVIGKYINKETPIKHKCLIDGYEWNGIPHNILRGAKCPRCSKVERYTTDEFKKKLYSINPNIEVLSEYVKNNIPLKVKCLVDNNVWMVRPGDLLKGYGCPKCGVKKRAVSQTITMDEFLKRLDISHNGKIVLVGKYVNLKTKTKFKCIIDNTEWMARPSNIINNGTGCPVCANNIKYTKEEFVKLIKDINPNIEVLGDYNGLASKIECRCKVCGKRWYPNASNLKNRKSKCPICSKKLAGEAIRLSAEEFKTRLQKNNSNIEIIGNYRTTYDKVLVRCKICGYQWNANPSDLLYSKSGCPECAAKETESRLANKAKLLAKKMFGSNAKSEYRVCKNPKTGYTLPFDIYIKVHDTEYLIEINGEHHRKYDPYFHRKGISDFEYRKWIDKYKKDWAERNGYKYKVFWVKDSSINDVGKWFYSIQEKKILH